MARDLRRRRCRDRPARTRMPTTGALGSPMNQWLGRRRDTASRSTPRSASSPPDRRPRDRNSYLTRMDCAGTLSRVLPSDRVSEIQACAAAPVSPSSPSCRSWRPAPPAAQQRAERRLGGPERPAVGRARRKRIAQRGRLRQGQPRRRDAGQAHARHGQPGLPAVLRRERGRQQDRSVGARRPDQRPGLRDRPSATPSPSSSASATDEVAWTVVPVHERVRARAQGLRLRPQPGVVQARASRDRRPDRRLLLRQPVARGARDRARSRRRRPSPR